MPAYWLIAVCHSNLGDTLIVYTVVYVWMFFLLFVVVAVVMLLFYVIALLVTAELQT